jgi:ferredoxin
MTNSYDGFRAGMLRAAEMARQEFKRAPEAAKGNDCVWMGGYESACDHLSVVIAQAAVIDSVRAAGAQPDWQYHIALLLPDGAVDDQALLKIYQVVEHELAALTAEGDRLKEALANYVRFSDEAARLSDADKDHKCLKLLLAMCGRAPRYRHDVDGAYAALHNGHLCAGCGGPMGMLHTSVCSRRCADAVAELGES